MTKNNLHIKGYIVSLNLHCNLVDLWQTPSLVTVLCLMNHEGVQPNVTGKEAVRALRGYLRWAEIQIPYPVCNDDGQRLANDEFRDKTLWEHRKEVEAVFGREDLEVWLT